MPFCMLLALWYFYLNTGAGRGSGDRRDNQVDVRSQFGPLLLAQHNDGYFAARKVLLIEQILVSRHEHFEPRGFRNVE